MSLEEQEYLTKQKLMVARGKVLLFGMDFDGTLSDGENYTKETAIALFIEILEKNKTPAFITARAATAVKHFVPPLEDYYKAHPTAIATYIGGGNGTVLYSVNSGGVRKIYNNGLTLDEIRFIVSEWQKYAETELPVASLSKKGLITFKKFYSETWEGLIPEAVLAAGRAYEGRIFTEEAKVTFVLPKDTEIHNKIIADIQSKVGNEFSAVAGDKDFCHITKRLHSDSKAVAIETILKELNLNKDQVATFGDMPHGNDKGLLSFPFSFTNEGEIDSINPINKPPYILPIEGLGPIARVYKAVRFLL